VNEVTKVREPVYACGHSPGELERLQAQGAFFEEITRRVFDAAGLSRASRVLDIGCGVGDVSFLAAQMISSVGSAARVVGVDRAPEAIAVARQRARREQGASFEFQVGSVDQIPDGEPFDALIGRFVLMHQADAAATLGAAARHVRAGGLVVMLESAMTACVPGYHSWPHSPRYDRITCVITGILRAAGADTAMGLRLPEVFAAAGLPQPRTWLQSRVEGGPDAAIYGFIAESVRSLLPLAEPLGVEAGGIGDIDQLAQELKTEVVASGGVLVSPPVVGAWSTVD